MAEVLPTFEVTCGELSRYSPLAYETKMNHCNLKPCVRETEREKPCLSEAGAGLHFGPDPWQQSDDSIPQTPELN